jgi:small subunit ribosomal protein S20
MFRAFLGRQNVNLVIDIALRFASLGGSLNRGNHFTMPNTKSAERRMRNSARKQLANKSVKSRLKTLEASYLAALKKDKTEAEKALRSISSALDKAAKSGVIHRGQASRKKSRLSVRMAAIAKAA